MEISITKTILAAVTSEQNRHAVAHVPVFFSDSEEERKRIVLVLSRILEAVAHDLGNNVLVLVKH